MPEFEDKKGIKKKVELSIFRRSNPDKDYSQWTVKQLNAEILEWCYLDANLTLKR